jgi:small subunit ribosomal protein S1
MKSSFDFSLYAWYNQSLRKKRICGECVMDTNLASGTPTDINEIKRKQHFSGTVVKTTLAGAIVDIGMGMPAVVHISQLQREPVKRVEDVVQVGQQVDVWVHRVYPKKNRIELTMVKPLDYEWGELKKDLVVSGKVVRLEKFGVFVDIGAERPGLVHISEMTHDYIRQPGDLVKEGDEIEVKILDVNKQKRQIKLSMKALQEKPDDVVKAVLSSKDKVTQREQKEKVVEEAEEQKEVPVPTAMEVALREAMGRNQPEMVGELKKKRKGSETSKELESILSRTLKGRTFSK